MKIKDYLDLKEKTVRFDRSKAEEEISVLLRNEVKGETEQEFVRNWKKQLEEIIEDCQSNTYNFFDILKLNKKPDIDFVAKGIERKTIAMLSGASGAGKGFWLNHLLFSTLNLTSSYEDGDLRKNHSNFLLEGLNKIPTIGYFSFEDGYKQWMRRAYDCVDTYLPVDKEAKEEAIKYIQNTFYFYDMSTRGAMFKNDKRGVDETVINEMKEKILKDKIDLVIIDTLSVINQKYDENDNVEMAMLLEDLKSFARDTNTGILIIHHETKQSLNANTPTSEANLRGASSLVGNSRFILGLERCRIEDSNNKKNKIFCENYIKVKITKANFTKFEERIYVRNDKGVLTQMPEGFVVVDDKLNGSKNKVI